MHISMVIVLINCMLGYQRLNIYDVSWRTKASTLQTKKPLLIAVLRRLGCRFYVAPICVAGVSSV